MKNGRELYGGTGALSLVALLLRVRLSALIHTPTLFLESFRSRICSFPSARPTWSPSPRREEPGCASTSLPELRPRQPCAPRLAGTAAAPAFWEEMWVCHLGAFVQDYFQRWPLPDEGGCRCPSCLRRGTSQWLWHSLAPS